MLADRRSTPERNPKARVKATPGQVARDITFAAGAVILVIGAIFAYSGVWPPMVVVESGSMMHSDTESFVGVIDTGDLTLTKRLARDSDVITYLQGAASGYRTYGSFGDVLIYAKNGHREPGTTPIIHRAITRVTVNSTNPDCIDLPEIASPDRFCRLAGSVDLGPVWTWDRAHEGGALVNLTVDLTLVMRSMGGYVHGGFLTKGDHNDRIDEGNLQALNPEGHPGSNTVQPVMFEWIVGKAEGELPWFGAIKLALSHNTNPIPEKSTYLLILSIVIIALGPLGVETLWRRYGPAVKARIPAPWRARAVALADKLPGGKGRAKERAAQAEERRIHEDERVRHRRKKRHTPEIPDKPLQ
jgi:signal peptidase I